MTPLPMNTMFEKEPREEALEERKKRKEMIVKNVPPTTPCKLKGIFGVQIYAYNRPFPSCLLPLFQSESWCIAFHMKMSIHSHADKTHFHMKGFA